MFPDITAKFKSIYAEIQVVKLSTETKSSCFEATTDFDFLSQKISNHLSDLLKLGAKL